MDIWRGQIGSLLPLPFVDDLTPKTVFVIFTDHMKKQYGSRKKKNQPINKEKFAWINNQVELDTTLPIDGHQLHYSDMFQ